MKVGGFLIHLADVKRIVFDFFSAIATQHNIRTNEVTKNILLINFLHAFLYYALKTRIIYKFLYWINFFEYDFSLPQKICDYSGQG